mgnify:FL=1
MEKLPKRKNIRIKDYDYSQNGYYFITICTKDRENLFWEEESIFNLGIGDLVLTNIGEIIKRGINDINNHYKNVKVHKYVIMPNHIHLILVLEGEMPKSPSVPRVIQQLKGIITKEVGFSIWQRSFYDQIIRNEKQYEEIWNYIDTNPLKWNEDKYYLQNHS